MPKRNSTPSTSRSTDHEQDKKRARPAIKAKDTSASASAAATAPALASIPVVQERSETDAILGRILTWKSGGGSSFLFCISKFKILAERIHKEVVLRNAEGCDSLSPHIHAAPLSFSKKLKPVLSQQARVRQGVLLLRERLRFLGLDTVDMVGDGNCQFRCEQTGRLYFISLGSQLA
jgi:hypothetical protein